MARPIRVAKSVRQRASPLTLSAAAAAAHRRLSRTAMAAEAKDPLLETKLVDAVTEPGTDVQRTLGEVMEGKRTVVALLRRFG